ncbi:MAG: hypothetical protein AAGJ83_00345 [Planctomycetota bacterium]
MLRPTARGVVLGAPLKPDAKVTKTVVLSQEVAYWMQSQENASDKIEDIIRRTKSFRSWRRALN